MLGVQLWLNLPQKEKMTDPTYFDITGNMIGSKKTDNAIIHVLAGEYDSIKGVEPPHIKATIYDVELQAGKSITLPTKTEDNVFIFLIEGNAIIDGTNIPEKLQCSLVRAMKYLSVLNQINNYVLCSVLLSL